MTAPVIVLSDLRKRYGDKEALRGITLEIGEGAVGLLGPNGAGKSTLLKALLGLIPFDGSARVLGLDPRTEARRLREQIGYVPERDAHPPGATGVEECIYAAQLSGLPRPAAIERAHATLELVGLGEQRYQPVDGYSTGMKQRARLAAALVHDPRLVLLDEPTNGLDPAGRDEVLALIASLPRRTGCTVLLSSHLLHDVETVCDRAIVLGGGTLLAMGTLAELAGDEEADLFEVRVKEGDDRFERALAAQGMNPTREGPLWLVRVSAPRSAMAIFGAAKEAGVQVRHLRPRQRTLERAFVRALEQAGQPARGAT
jgi:ABC-2 type transport system ATP-binding protein